MTEPTKPRRRRFGLSIRALMVLVLLIGGVLGWKARRATLQRQVVAAIKEAGGSVKYDYEWGRAPNGDPIFLLNPQPWAPAWLRRAVGDEYFQEVATVNLFRPLNPQPPLPPAANLFETIGRLDQLESLSTVRYPLDDADFARIMAMPRLREAFVMDVDVTEAGLKAVETSPAIEKLSLRFKKGTVTGRAIEAIARQPRLRQLNLIFIDVTDPASMAPLAKLPRLEYLRLYTSPVDEACLVPLRDLTELKEIYLGETKISDAGVESLAKLDKLDEVWMDGSNLTDAGLTRLANHTHLNVLGLNHASNITDASLASLERHTSMTYLFLTGSNVTDAGLDHLKGMKLEGLAISGKGVTDAGLAKLQPMTRLRTLSIVGTSITAEACEAFRKSHPGVKIEGGPSEPEG